MDYLSIIEEFLKDQGICYTLVFGPRRAIGAQVGKVVIYTAYNFLYIYGGRTSSRIEIDDPKAFEKLVKSITDINAECL